MLTALRKAFPDRGYVFTTERRTPLTTDAINRLIKTSATAPSCRCRSTSTCCHSCGYKLANDGIDTRAIQDWFGQVSIMHTTRYPQLSPARFKDFWRD